MRDRLQPLQSSNPGDEPQDSERTHIYVTAESSVLSEYISHMPIDRGGTALRDGVDSNLLRRRDNAVPIFLALRKAVKISGEGGVIYQHLHNEPVRLKECHISRAPNEVETIWDSLTYKHRVRFCTIILIAST